MGYANPPWVPDCQSVAERVQAQEATIIIVVPYWQTQACFSLFMSLLIDYLILIPQVPMIISAISQLQWGVIPDPNALTDRCNDSRQTFPGNRNSRRCY